jgi:hypothetical protein
MGKGKSAFYIKYKVYILSAETRLFL